MKLKSNSAHWNRIFRETADEKMGWYESDPAETIRLLNVIPNWKDSTIFLPGAGTSVLIETLIEAGSKLVLNDISSEALNSVEKRLGDKGTGCEWLCQDIARPLNCSSPIDIWIDRAVLHFLLEEVDIQGYFKNVLTAVRVGGYALFAEFSPNGAPKCAGLKLHRYSVEELSDRLGSEFTLIEHFDHIYINPAGDPRPYIYTLFKRE
jgi:SAM-dependent methyltransferase